MIAPNSVISLQLSLFSFHTFFWFFGALLFQYLDVNPRFASPTNQKKIAQTMWRSEINLVFVEHFLNFFFVDSLFWEETRFFCKLASTAEKQKVLRLEKKAWRGVHRSLVVSLQIRQVCFVRQIHTRGEERGFCTGNK